MLIAMHISGRVLGGSGVFFFGNMIAGKYRWEIQLVAKRRQDLNNYSEADMGSTGWGVGTALDGSYDSGRLQLLKQ